MNQVQNRLVGSPRTPPWFAVSALVILCSLSGCRFVEDRLDLVPPAPSVEVERLAQATTMTPLAQRLFYRQSPTVENRSAFLAQCKASADIIILGCYLELKRVDGQGRLLSDRSLDGKIVIQVIDDPQFAGTMEVAAAHEMLHAAYVQLSATRRAELGQQLEAALEQVENPRLLNILADYRAAGDVERYHHELHAHLGTELKTFSNPALEAHYQRYFRDRQRVVAFAEQSVRVITEFDQQAEALDSEIKTFERELTQFQEEIESHALRLEETGRSLDRQKASLDRLRVDAETALQNNDFSGNRLVAQFKQDQLIFNHEVEAHNAQVERQVQRVEDFNRKRQDYEQAVDSYNHIARETRQVLEGLKGPALSGTAAAQP